MESFYLKLHMLRASLNKKKCFEIRPNLINLLISSLYKHIYYIGIYIGIEYIVTECIYIKCIQTIAEKNWWPSLRGQKRRKIT